MQRTRVSNPGRNVWDAGGPPEAHLVCRRFKSRKERLGRRSSTWRSAWYWSFKSRKERLGPTSAAARSAERRTFQIPEGTFGTSTPPYGEGIIPRFKSRKERLGPRLCGPHLVQDWGFKSRKERLGPTGKRTTAMTRWSFKSRKERLGRFLPRGRVWFSRGFKSRKERLGRLLKTSSSFWKRRFKSRKERLGPRPGPFSRKGSAKFQIPEGTFGTWCSTRRSPASSPCFKSRKERLGRSFSRRDSNS